MLKNILFLLALIVGWNELKADCSSNYLSVFPTSDTVAKNSLFLLEGYGMSQKVINGLNKEYQVYLFANGKRINLLVKETLVGEFLLTQALLRPEFPLETGVTYTLTIDNLPAHEKLAKYDYTTRKYKPVTFVSSSFTDSVSPVVERNPVEINKQYISFGCGPQKMVVFDCPVKDSSELLVRTTVKNIATGKSTTYILSPVTTQIGVGHGMCSGEFNFGGGNPYAVTADKFEVTFVFMDLSGNFTKTTPPVQITEPVPDDGEGY